VARRAAYHGIDRIPPGTSDLLAPQRDGVRGSSQRLTHGRPRGAYRRGTRRFSVARPLPA